MRDLLRRGLSQHIYTQHVLLILLYQQVVPEVPAIVIVAVRWPLGTNKTNILHKQSINRSFTIDTIEY